MGSSPSQVEDVKSIHGKNNESERVSKAGLGIAKVLLDNLEEVTKVVGPVSTGPAGILVGKCLSVIVVGFLDKQSNVKEVFEKIKALFHEELTEMEMDEIQAIVEGTLHWLRIDFPDRLKANRDSHELYEEFYEQEKNLREAIDVLMSQRFRGPAGLMVFMLGASLHLSMLVDLARLDYRQLKWKDSVHAADFKERAIEYAKHAEATTDEMLQERQSKVKLKCKESSSYSMAGSRDIRKKTSTTYTWADEQTDQWGVCENTEYRRRVHAVRERMDEDIGRPRKTAKKWRTMAAIN